MDEHEWLAAQFEAECPHLRWVAYRMLPAAEKTSIQQAWELF